MKAIIYSVTCPDCEEELFEGDKLEVKNWLKNNDKDGYEEWDEDNVQVLCNDCVWLLDK